MPSHTRNVKQRRGNERTQPPFLCHNFASEPISTTAGMTTLTADLEYFKCDQCSIYFFKDIYCDHRRQCKGLDNPELKKKEVAAIASRIDAADRCRLIAAGESRCVLDLVPIEQKEKILASKVRSQLLDDYLQDKNREEAAKPRRSNAELLAFLDS